MVSVPSADARFRRIFDEHCASVQSYCLRRLPVEDAKEATLEVFSIVWLRMDAVPTGEATIRWLYGVAHNTVRNHRRARRRAVRLVAKVAASGRSFPPETDQQVIGHFEAIEVRDALATLGAADRELLRLKAWEELSNAEVGEILGISARAVEGRYARALKRLARAMATAPRRSPRHHAARVADERGRP